jgi:hypothetical protein
MTTENTTDTAAGLALPLASKGDKAFLRGTIELAEERVPIPEWGRTMIVREMTAAENRDYQLSNVKFDKGGNPKGMNKQDVDLRLLQRTCVDEQGNRVFSEDDFPLLRKQPAKIVLKLVRVAKTLSGLNDDEEVDERIENEKND